MIREKLTKKTIKKENFIHYKIPITSRVCIYTHYTILMHRLVPTYM